MHCADWNFYSFSSIEATGIVEWETERCIVGRLLRCFVAFMESGQDSLMYSFCIIDIIQCVIVYKAVLVPKGWFKAEERRSGWKKKRERNGDVHSRHSVRGDAEASSGFYIDMTEVVYCTQPTRMWSPSFTLLPLSRFFTLMLLLVTCCFCCWYLLVFLNLFLFSFVLKLKSTSL
jgi:hypothetical protein